MKKVGIIGAGTMGAGIIQVFAQGGYEVAYTSRSEATREKALALITKNLGRLVEKEKISGDERDAALGRISHGPDLSVVKGACLIVETIGEDLELKKKYFAELDEIADPDAVIASNTSAISISEIAGVTKRPDKIVGMHFFNPAPLMKLVEVIKGISTLDETEAMVIEIAKEIGKTPVKVKEAPGFIVNRILVPMINEGVSIYADGVASVEDIDEALKLGANHVMGPLALGDLIGLDVCLSIMETLYAEFGDPKYRPHPLLRTMVRGGKLGRKAGEGFYKY